MAQVTKELPLTGEAWWGCHWVCEKLSFYHLGMMARWDVFKMYIFYFVNV